MGDQIVLVVVGAVELGAVDAGEAPREIEVLQDRPGVVVRLGRGNEQPAAGHPQPIERIGDAVVDDGVEHGPVYIALAIMADGFFGQVGPTEQLGEGDAKRRPDQPQQLLGRRHRQSKLAQSILHGPDQPRLGIDQRAIQIDEDVQLRPPR
jgi:hypothetical protein